jgi:hypothetical protein
MVSGLFLSSIWSFLVEGGLFKGKLREEKDLVGSNQFCEGVVVKGKSHGSCTSGGTVIRV